MAYKIFDNFLSAEDADKIENIMSSAEFPWYASIQMTPDFMRNVDPTKVRMGYSDPNSIEMEIRMIHMFYRKYNSCSDFYSLLTPLLEKINANAYVRIKANLNWRTEKPMKTGFHTDLSYSPIYTAIYYVNTNNGYTLFEDGTKIESVKNRFLVFNTNTIHCAVTSTDTKFRYVINFNFFSRLFDEIL